jgi:hypothetical protein
MDTRVISASQFEQLEATMKGNDARVAAARSRVADTVIRAPFSGVALSFNLAFSIFSGLAPVIAASLAATTGVAATAAYYMIGCAALSFVAALFMHRYDGRILADLASDGPG